MRYTPGTFSVSEVELYSEITKENFNILSIVRVLEVNLYSNLMDDSLTASIVLEDTINFLGNLPIIGNEVVQLGFVIPESDDGTVVLRKKFRVEQISNVNNINPGTRSYILELSSLEIFKSNQTSVKKSFVDSTISDIADRVYELLRTSKKLDIEKTQNIHNFIIPNWTVFNTLGWLATKAVSTQSKGANYLFYENLDGYNFKSLETLFRNDVYRTFVSGMDSIDPNATEQRFDNIYEMVIQKTFNVLQNQKSGMYTSKLITHSLLDRETKIYDFNYSDSFSSYSHLEKNMLVPSSKLTRDGMDYLGDTSNNYVMPASTQFQPEKLLQIRKSQLQQLNGIIVEITVVGDANMRVGNVVELDINSPQPLISSDEGVKADPYFSGKYIVDAIRHTISDSHFMKLSLRKDSLVTPLTDKKIETKY